MKQLLSIFTVLFAVILLSGSSFAQDAAKLDPKHYKVEFENDQVRVLRITYGPGEKSKMHSHAEGVVVFLSDGKGKFTFPDGKTQEMDFESGKVVWTDETTHQPENIGDEPFEVIQIEMKNKK
jgi:mannose-6-phosphate isomerase-like protein (cupin superfamily)